MYDFWHFLAGLGLFLYGIAEIEVALKNLGGQKFVKFLRNHTKSPSESIISGTLLTALLQSSSLVSLIVLAFVGSRYIPMPNALGMIMGANLGTTFTGWIVAIFGFKLDIESYALPIVAIGAIGIVFLLRKSKARYISMTIFGFGLLLFGLGFMKNGMDSMINTVDIDSYSHFNYFYFFLLGIVVTAVIQSSSAMMAIVLSALSLESISITQAAATVIGADLGTTVTVVLGSLSGATVKKQVALFHVVFNLIVDVLALIFLPLLLLTINEVIQVEDPLFSLVLFHNLFNVIGILLFFPFLKYIAEYINRIFKVKSDCAAKFINSVDYKIPSMPLDSLRCEIEHMIIQVIKFNMQVLDVNAQKQREILNMISKYSLFEMSIPERYEHIKKLESEIINYTSTLIKQSLSDDDRKSLFLWTASARNLVHSARSMKSINEDIIELIRIDDVHSYNNKEELIKSSYSLYKQAIALINSNDMTNKIDKLEQLDSSNEHTHDSLVKYIYSNYSVNVSTPLNVIREIYSSNKALVNALKEYMLSVDKLNQLDNFPALIR
jgi:phosphate:Na+ symporter